MILVQNRPIGPVGTKVILVWFWYGCIPAGEKQLWKKCTRSLKPLQFKAPVNSTFMESSGDKRDRTADLLNAIQALSQLSYTPIGLWAFCCPQRGLV